MGRRRGQRIHPSNRFLRSWICECRPIVPRLRLLIMAAAVCHPLAAPPLVTSQLRPLSLPEEAPGPARANRASMPVTITAIHQEQAGPIFKLRGDVRIDYGTYTLSADEVTYNSDSRVVEGEGHLVLEGGPNDEHVEAERGQYNLDGETGRFENVRGSVGVNFKRRPNILTTTNPFFFTGKVVEKRGPDHYLVVDGRVTTCELPHPKWQFAARKVVIELGGNAKIYHSDFRLGGLPILYLPFATHPVQKEPRQSGFLLPNLGKSSTRGYTVGESAFWAINRSIDLLAGAEYFSRRGWAPDGEFRARPGDNSFVDLTFFSVLDRGVSGVNQGGTEVRLNTEDAFRDNLRGVANLDYLSSYVFRLAFSDVFSQAVNSEVRSTAFISDTASSLWLNAAGRRYQNFESTTSGDVITILHAPGIEVASADRPLAGSVVHGSFDFALEGLSRSEPDFRTAPLLGRLDLAPALSVPLVFGGWSLRPAIALRGTFYTQQLRPATSSSAVGTALSETLTRRSFEGSLELRPPALERVFARELFGRRWKHVFEPRIRYDYVTGVDNFAHILRFDDRDILSDTDEVEYAFVNRLYAKRTAPGRDECPAEGMPALIVGAAPPPRRVPWERNVRPGEAPCPALTGTREILTWELAEKYFFDPTFGGALVPGKSNIFTNTVDLTGIAFLTQPRHLSPLISRLRAVTGVRTDLEWDLDYDFQARRVNTSTALFNYRFGQLTFGAGSAFLHVPGEITSPASGLVAERFDQFRSVIGYGSANKRGFSGAVNLGFDVELNHLQYGSAQVAYNWDCCGINLEYRRFALASVRNENQFRFTFALANVGAFGNLRRTERLF